MRSALSANAFLRCIILSIAGFILPCNQLSADWDVTQFEVVQGEPDSFLDAIAEGLGVVDLDEATVAEIENFLSDVAREYEYLGFRGPAIDHKSAGGYAYQVFLFDYKDSDSPAAYSVACNGFDSRRYIRIDSSRVMNGGRIDPKFYEHLAHELFHAVQGSYDLFYDNCSLGDWITEGTAEAMGVDTTYKLRKIKPPEPRIRWGGRPYINPLRVGDGDTARRDEGYWTSSLWRYIGEHIAVGAGRAGTKYLPADYTYLTKLFERDLDGSAGFASEVDWLDEGLESLTGLGLERIYPNFISTFAAYVPGREGTAKNAEVWRKWLFETCPTVPLSTQRTSATVSRGLNQITAGCFIVNVSIPDQVDIAMQVDNVDLEGLKALSIGTADGSKVGKATIIENPAQPGSHFGSWLFRVPTDTPQLFVISNISPKASDTRTLTPVVKLSVSAWKSSMTRARPQEHTAGKPAGTGGQQPDPTVKQTADELKSGAQSLSAHVSAGATTRMRPDEPTCSDAFVYRGCGPSTIIRLNLMPGSLGNLGYVTGTGGGLAQIMGTFSGMAQADPAELGSDWMKSAETIGNMDGGEIYIVIPLIDYGFSGSFNNASISVSGAGDSFYYAMGPRDGVPGPGIEFPLSGTVNIEEFSPYVMRGTFSAELVDRSRIPHFETDDPVLPVHANIKGSFNIVNPWQGDRRARIKNDGADLSADLLEAFPALAKNGRAAIGKSQAPQVDRGTSDNASGTGAGTQQCNCSCNQAANPDPICDTSCGATYAACAGIKHEAPVRSTVELAGEDAELIEIREKFEALVEALFPGEASEELRDTTMKTFDDQRSLNEKKMMILSYGGQL